MQDKEYNILGKENLKRAFLYIAINIYENIKSSKSNTISIDAIEQTTTLCLLNTIINRIADPNAKIATRLFSNSELTIIDLIKIDWNDFFVKHPNFDKLNKSNIEEIGIAYDILQNFRLKEKKSALTVENCCKNKKKNGSFYTPIPIVDYIIKNTFGMYLQKLKSHCSDNEFFKLLLNIKILDPSVGGGIFLIRLVKYLDNWLKSNLNSISIQKRRNYIDKFIENCLYGIDINRLACNVTKISLQLLLEKSAIIKNIICTNAIEIFSESNRMNNLENSISDQKFDIIVSNPPFQFGANLPKIKRRISTQFEFATGQFDLYWLFYEFAMKKALKSGGYHGYIIPDSLLTRDEAQIVRSVLLTKKIQNIWHTGLAFNGLQVSSIVLIWENSSPDNQHKINVMDTLENSWKQSQNLFKNNEKSKFLIYLNSLIHTKIINKLSDAKMRLQNISSICRGEEIGKKMLRQSSDKDKKVLCGQNILPYKIMNPSYSLKNSKIVQKKEIYKGKKLLIRKTGADLVSAYDNIGHIFLQSVYCLKINNDIPQKQKNKIYKTLLGILNSKLINFYIYNTFTAYKLVYPQLNQSTIKSIPLPSDFFEKDWTELIKLVDKRIKCSKNSFDSLQAEIDAIVYSAYNLTNKEIALVNKHQTRISFKR